MKNKLEKVVITGGAGFIGSNLAKYLYENGTEEILLIDQRARKKAEELLKEFKIA